MPERYTTGLLFAAICGIVAVLLSSSRSTSKATPFVERIPGKNNTVLFVTSQELGFANIHLATAQALLVHHPDVSVHIASFARLEKDAQAINQWHAAQSPSSPSSIIFHNLTGPTAAEALERSTGYHYLDLIHRPGIAGVELARKVSADVISPYMPEDHIALLYNIREVIDRVDPAFILVDPMFPPSQDAADSSGRYYGVLSPNSLVDSFAQFQKRLSFLWKYPALASAHSFPVPLHLMVKNAWWTITVGYSVVASNQFKVIKEALQSHGITEPRNLVNLYQSHIPWISPSIPGVIDLPLPDLPPNVTTCGPILILGQPAEEQDPELTAWTAKKRTVLVNLGSHIKYDEKKTLEMIRAMKRVLKELDDVQFLWKFRKATKFGDEFKNEIEEELKDGRIRLESWLNVDPPALLETGNIAVMVNHGGASSYFEAVAMGVPQISLPLWFDCYSYAKRVEYLGIGVWGNQDPNIDWNEDELTNAFLKVLKDGEESKRIRERAKELSDASGRGSGSKVAADRVAELVRR